MTARIVVPTVDNGGPRGSPRRLNVSGRIQFHLDPPGGAKEVGAQFLDRYVGEYSQAHQS
jgi:hypothetical protein